jgi:hypothetical protein
MPDIFDQLAAAQPGSPNGLPAPAPATMVQPGQPGAPQPQQGDIFDQIAAQKPATTQQAQPANAPAPWWKSFVNGAGTFLGEAESDDPILGGIVGGVKSAADTVHRVSGALGDVSAGVTDPAHFRSPVHNFTDATPEALQTHGLAEGTGKFVEQAGEFLLGGEGLKGGQLALKGGLEGTRLATLLENPTLAKIVNNGLVKFVGRTAGSAAVGAAQAPLHGDSPVAGAVGAAAGGAVAEGIGAGLGKLGEKASDVVVPDVFQGQGVPLSAGQRTQNKALLAIEGGLKRIPFIGGAADKLAAEQNVWVQQNARALGQAMAMTPEEADAVELYKATGSPESIRSGNKVLGANVPGSDFTKRIAVTLNDAQQVVKDHYGDVMDQIAEAGGNSARVPITGVVKNTAQDLLGQINLPKGFDAGLKDVQGVKQLHDFLSQFVGDARPATGGAASSDLAVGRPWFGSASVPAPKDMSWEEANNLRKAIENVAYSGDMNSAKGALSKMSGALRTAMSDALGGVTDATHAPGVLRNQFNAAAKTYSQMMTDTSNSVIDGIMNGTPNNVAPAILGKNGRSLLAGIDRTLDAGSGSAAGALEEQQTVRRAVWDHLWQSAVGPDGVFNGVQFSKSFQKIDDGLKADLFRGPALSTVNQFASLVGKLMPKEVPPSGAAKLAQNVASGFATGEGLIHAGPLGVAIAIPGLTVLHLSSQALFDQPGTMRDVTKLVETSLNSKSSVGQWVKANRPVLARVAKAALQKTGSSAAQPGSGNGQ